MNNVFVSVGGDRINGASKAMLVRLSFHVLDKDLNAAQVPGVLSSFQPVFEDDFTVPITQTRSVFLFSSIIGSDSSKET